MVFTYNYKQGTFTYRKSLRVSAVSITFWFLPCCVPLHALVLSLDSMSFQFSRRVASCHSDQLVESMRPRPHGAGGSMSFTPAGLLRRGRRARADPVAAAAGLGSRPGLGTEHACRPSGSSAGCPRPSSSSPAEVRGHPSPAELPPQAAGHECPLGRAAAKCGVCCRQTLAFRAAGQPSAAGTRLPVVGRDRDTGLFASPPPSPPLSLSRQTRR